MQIQNLLELQFCLFLPTEHVHLAGSGADAPLLAFNSSLFGAAAAHTSFDSVSWGAGPEKVALIPFLPVLPPPLCTAHHICFISEAVIPYQG